MRIVNLIHIGDQVLSLDDMDPMKKAEIALRLNEQSLKICSQEERGISVTTGIPCPVRGVFPTPHSPFTQLKRACPGFPTWASRRGHGQA